MEKELEALANQLFKTLPNGSVSDNRVLDSGDFSLDKPQTSLNDPLFVQGQTGGNNTLGRDFTENYIFENVNRGSSAVPDFIEKSEKDYAQIYSNFDIQNPQTSYQDTAFYDGKIPVSVAGSGKQPGISNSLFYSQENVVPFQETYDDHLGGLSGLLGQITQFKHLPQIPLDAGALPYYFLEGGFDFSQVQTGYPGQEAVNGRLTSFSGKAFDVAAVRRDFPILNEQVNGRKLVWFDNAATTQKPQSVIDRISYFYQHENSNIHRAAHELAARATDAYEEARQIIRGFLNATSVNEIIFTRGTTESINLVAHSWGGQNLKEGDEIIISHLEHHANIVPWQQLAKKIGFTIKVIPVDDEGNLLLDEYVKLLNPKTKLVAFTHVSNALGTVTPAKTIIDLAHAVGAKVLLDGAQSVSHIKVDLQYLNPDFFVFSGHKIFGPTGIGVLYGKEEILNNTQPYQSGGNMIQDVTFEKTVFHNAPNRFEAGTGNIADAVGLAAAIQYVQKIGIDNIYQYEHDLLTYATHCFKQIPGVRLIGTARDKTSVMSFTLKGYNNEEVGKALNEVGIAVRTGHHCAQPILRRLGVESSVRPSFAFYNTRQEVDLLAQTVYALSKKKN